MAAVALVSLPPGAELLLATEAAMHTLALAHLPVCVMYIHARSGRIRVRMRVRMV